jgi:hypothetical protein
VVPVLDRCPTATPGEWATSFEVPFLSPPSTVLVPFFGASPLRKVRQSMTTTGDVEAPGESAPLDDLDSASLAAAAAAAQKAADRKRVKWLRIGLAIFLVVVVIGITASFLASSATARQDQLPRRYVGVGAAGTPNYVEIDARIGKIDPLNNQVTVRIDTIPHGKYAVNTWALSQAMIMEVDGVSGGHVAFAANQSPEPVDAQMELLGNLSQYPFDSYRWFLAVSLLQGTSSSGATTNTSDVIPITVVLSSTQHDWRVVPKLASVRTDGTVDINLFANRAVGTVGLALFEMFIMVAVAAIALCISYTAIAGHHELSWGLFGWLGAMLFALPAIRNTMPGVPGTGTLADYTVYFWAILTVALCLLVIGVTYIRRTIKVEEHGK